MDGFKPFASHFSVTCEYGCMIRWKGMVIYTYYLGNNDSQGVASEKKA